MSSTGVEHLDRPLPKEDLKKASKSAGAAAMQLRLRKICILFLANGRIEMDSNAVERRVRPVSMQWKLNLTA